MKNYVFLSTHFPKFLLWICILLGVFSCNPKEEDNTPSPINCFKIELVSGSDTINPTLIQKLPLRVKVTDQSGSPIRDVTVYWNLTSGKGMINATSITADNGEATNEWTVENTRTIEKATASLRNDNTCTLKNEVEFIATPDLSYYNCLDKEITQNTTWEDKVAGEEIDYRISCDISVTGSAMLTIAPGVIIEFEGAGSGIFTSENAGLFVAGTKEAPIIFKGKSGKKGNWQGIFFGSNHPLNQLNFVTVRDAGSTASTLTKEKSGVQLNREKDSRALITNSIITNNDGYGVYISKGSNLSDFSTNLITNNALSPIAIPFTAINKLNSTSEFGAANGQAFIQVISEDLVASDLTIEKLALPYRISTAKIFIVKALTIEPGVTLEFETGTGFRLGHQASDQLDRTGSIKAVGTASDSITFRGTINGKGSWLGIGINSSSPNNQFIFCNISGGGSSQMYNAGGKGNIVLINEGTTAIIKNSVIKNSLGWGIHKSFQLSYTISITESNNSYLNNELGDVSP